jgi:hypothetical protein
MLAHRSEPAAAVFITVRERAHPYRRDWYRDRGGVPTPHHPITVAAEKRARRRIGSATWQEIRELSGRLHEKLEGDLLRTWLALEGNLYAYLLEIAAEHYNLGVDTTLGARPPATGVSATDVTVSSEMKDRLKYLLKALGEEIERLP